LSTAITGNVRMTECSQPYTCHGSCLLSLYCDVRGVSYQKESGINSIEEHPKYGPGRPSQQQPRVVKALRYGLKATLHERAEVIACKRQETGCFVLLTNVPTAGAMAHQARDVLRAYKEQHGIEQNFAFLKAPLIVNSLFLKKPERNRHYRE